MYQSRTPESVFGGDARLGGLRRDFQGWDWEPVNIEQPTRTTRRLLNLKDELSLNIELLLAGA